MTPAASGGIYDGGMTIVRACTRHGLGGSPTAVLMDDVTLTDSARRTIVQQAGTSHAAFIDTGVETAVNVRFFTTSGELTNCGHGTIAAQAVLLELRHTAEHRGQQRTGGRTFDTTAVRRGDGIEVWFDQGVVELQDCTTTAARRILASLGIGARDLATDDDLCIASPGTPRLLVPIRSRETLLSLRPDFDRLAAECRRLGLLGCFGYVPSVTWDAVAQEIVAQEIVTQEIVTQDAVTQAAVAARMFAPAIGVGEDIINANSSGCLAAYLLAKHGTVSVEVEQGDALGHPSSVFATATAVDGGISTRVGGVAVIHPNSDASS